MLHAFGMTSSATKTGSNRHTGAKARSAHRVAGTGRVRAARQRAATEREQRIERAIKAMDEIDKSLSRKRKKRPADTSPADTTHDETAQTERSEPARTAA